MNISLKDRLAIRAEDADRGDLVQTVLLIAGFAIVAILIVTWLGTAILNKGSDAASCIEGSSGYNQNSSTDACQQNAASAHGFQSDAGYSSRYN